jgi:hypothetical protein
MTRRTRPGSIQAAVRAAYRAVGGVECASDDLGVSAAALSYGTEITEARPGGLGVNYLDRLGRIEPRAALPVAEHFAALAGGVFQPVDLTGALAADVTHVTREFSDVLARHAEAHAPGSENPNDYTPDEAAEQIRELDELIAVSAVMRAALVRKSGGRA